MCRREALPFSDVSNESHRFTYSPSARPSDRPQFRTASDASPVRATSCRMPSETDRRVGERKRRKERVSGRPEELSSTGTINRLDCGVVSSLCANGGTDADSLSFPPSLLLSPFHFSFLHLPSQRKTWRSIGRAREHSLAAAGGEEAYCLLSFWGRHHFITNEIGMERPLNKDYVPSPKAR